MADLPISGLPLVVTPLPGDDFIVNNDGVSRQMTRQQMHTLEVGEVLLLPNGSDASTPELAFPNSGAYEDALDQFSIAQGGLQVAHATTPALGGLFVNNLATGGGLERVLTTSDTANFGEYRGTFNGAGPTFPAATNQGDWFNCTNPGTIDGQAFVLGDILVALIDSPSTSTFAGNWSLVPHIGQADHLLLSNIGVNTHAQIDAAITNSVNHIADASIHFSATTIASLYSSGNPHVTATDFGGSVIDFVGNDNDPTNPAGTFEATLDFLTENGLGLIGSIYFDSSSTMIIENDVYEGRLELWTLDNLGGGQAQLTLTPFGARPGIEIFHHGAGRTAEFPDNGSNGRGNLVLHGGATSNDMGIDLTDNIIGGNLQAQFGFQLATRLDMKNFKLNGNVAILGTRSAAGGEAVILNANPDTITELRAGTEINFNRAFGAEQAARTVAASAGGLEVNNTLTGAGLERVLTTADLGISAEVNDLTAAVTWANVPNANITVGSVTQHVGSINHDLLLNFSAGEHFTQAAISITASQISDFAAAVSANAAVAANTAKVSNVSTALSLGTVGINTVGITSDGGANDVVLPAATVAAAGMLTTAKWAEIVANTAKVSNSPTALSLGTVGINTVGITSDGGANDVVLPAATVAAAGMFPTSKWAEVVANNAKVSNATHTGDATGSVALTIANNVVTDAKLADMPNNSFKGRTTAGTGDPQNISVAANTVVGVFSGVLQAQQVQTAQIQNLAVSYAKMQNVTAASRLLGRGSAAGLGNVEQLTLGAGLTMTGTVLSSSAVLTPPIDLADNEEIRFGTGNDILMDFDATNFVIQGAGDFNTTGFTRFRHNGVIALLERATAPGDIATYGQLWARNTSDVELIFTDEIGLDMNISESLYSNGALQASATLLGLDVRDTLKVGSLGSTTGVLKLGDQASADADEAGYGQWWNTNATPNVPMFTTDSGVDGQLARLNFAQTWTVNQTFAANVDLVLATTGEVRFGTTTIFGFNGADSFIEMNGANNDLFITVESGGVNNTSAAFRGQSAGNIVELYSANVIQFTTQNNVSLGNTTGAQVKSHNGTLYDVGYNQLPVFNDNVSDTIEAAHSGQVAFKDATTARTLTLASNVSLDFPIFGMTTVINAFTSGNYTITEGASTTLYYLDGATRTDTTGGAIVGPGGVANIWRESATVYYIWGTGITP